MTKKFLCKCFGHNYALKPSMWLSSSSLIILLRCERCDKLLSVPIKRPHNWQNDLKES